jgi:hypothetical protein
MTLPAVAGLGLREASVVLILREYGVVEAQALTFSLAIFGLLVIAGLTGGALEAWDLLFGRFRRKRDVAGKKADGDGDGDGRA